MGYANNSTYFGFHPYRHGGSREPMRVRRVVAASRSADLMVGDAYSLDASGQASRAGGADTTPTVVKGIVEAIELNPIAASPNGPVSQDYIPAADAGAIIGIEDEDALFLVKMTTAAVSDTGKTFDLTNAGVSVLGPLLRKSQQAGDGATLGTGTQFVMHEIADRPTNNTAGAYVDVVCSILTALEA